MRVSLSLAPVVNLGASIGAPIKTGCLIALNTLKNIPQTTKRSGATIYRLINRNHYTRAAALIVLAGSALITIYLLRKPKNPPLPRLELEDAVPPSQEIPLEPISQQKASLNGIHARAESELSPEEAHNRLVQNCKREWKTLSFKEIVIDGCLELAKILKDPVDPELKALLLQKSAELPAVAVVQLCPALFGSYFLRSDYSNSQLRETFPNRFEAEVNSYDAVEMLAGCIGKDRFDELQLLNPHQVDLLAEEEVLYNLEYYIDNQVYLLTKPPELQKLFFESGQKFGTLVKEIYGSAEVNIIKWTADRSTILSEMRKALSKNVSGEKDPQLDQLFKTCQAEWPSLSFAEIVNSRKEQLERVLKAPIKDKCLRDMLLRKTDEMPVAEILKKCPLFFKTRFFRFDSCIICKTHTSPNFRERFTRETKSFEQILEIRSSAYGEDFFELGLIQPEILVKLAAKYILANSRWYLLSLMLPGHRFTVDPAPVRALANSYRNDISELRLEHSVAIKQPNADATALKTKLDEDIEEVIARFSARLTIAVDRILIP